MYNPNDYDNGDKPQANLFPIGKFVVQVIDHELTETSGGYKQVCVTFGNDAGQTRKAWYIYEGPARFQLSTLLKAVDWREPLDVEDTQAFRDAVYDKDVEIVVKSERYLGEDRVKVKYVNKAPRGTGQPSRTPADGYSAGHTAPTSGQDERTPPPPMDEDLF